MKSDKIVCETVQPWGMGIFIIFSFSLKMSLGLKSQYYTNSEIKKKGKIIYSIKILYYLIKIKFKN